MILALADLNSFSDYVNKVGRGRSYFAGLPAMNDAGFFFYLGPIKYCYLVEN